MGNKKHYKSTLERVKLIKMLTDRYYERGNNARCYKEVWRKYINPIYPMCYRTYLNYLNIDTPPAPLTTQLQLDFFSERLEKRERPQA